MTASSAIARAHLLSHPAARAWAELRPDGPEPVAIGRLQRKQKGCVYRLEGVGPGGSGIIAKCSSAERIRHERVVYEQVLPAIPASTVRCHGCVEEPDGGSAWLFVEDAAGEEYSPRRATHRALAARWLAVLHTSAARVPAAARLPDRGPLHYREHLRSACDGMSRGLGNPALGADDVAVLRAIIEQCETVAARWSDVERLCESLPRTLVHGDFAPKNMRIRAGPSGLTLHPFDWGSAGWGIPAADLAQWSAPVRWDYWATPDLARYGALVRESWPALDGRHLEPIATIGKIFRCLVCIDLSARSLATPWVERAARNMRVYRAEMAAALRAAGWIAGGAP